MNTSEAKRALKKAGFYIARILHGHNIELWTNGKKEIRMGMSKTLAPQAIKEINAALRDAIPEKKIVFKPHQAVLNTRVRALIDFQEVPVGTTGTIAELYKNGNGFKVQWDLPMSVRDGFDARTELVFLERI